MYEEAAGAELPEAALNASLGCRVATAVADLQDGETVLSLGSGAGTDVLISTHRVAPTGPYQTGSPTLTGRADARRHGRLDRLHC